MQVKGIWIIQLLESFKKNVLMHCPSIKKSLNRNSDTVKKLWNPKQ